MLYLRLSIALLVATLNASGQDDLSRLQGNFIPCEVLRSESVFDSLKVRPHKFVCGGTRGHVLQETPVKKITYLVVCRGRGKTYTEDTSPNCNTIGCVTNPDKLNRMSPESLPEPNVKNCRYSLVSADLFEFYPMFSTGGPNKDEWFQETMQINNEDDPDYTGRINGRFAADPRPEQPLEVSASKPVAADLEISPETQAVICKIPSLDSMPPAELDSYLRIILQMYQNTNFPDETFQRKAFCLLKNHYEKVSDFDRLMQLIAKMRFEQEHCLTK